MTQAAIPALRSLRDHAIALGERLTDEEWTMPSDCAGWQVRDVYAHMGGVFHGVVDPAFMRTGDDPNDMESGMEVAVAERRSWPVADVLAEYIEYSGQAIEQFAGLQVEGMAELEIPMGNLGTHPLHILANAFVFDAYCHLRNDLLAPYGPIEGPLPEPSAAHVAPILEWMLAGLPQMCADGLAFMDSPVVLEIIGEGGTTTLFGPAGDPKVTISTTPDAFIRWGTSRSDWRDEGVILVGDEAYGAAFCDAVNVI